MSRLQPPWMIAKQQKKKEKDESILPYQRDYSIPIDLNIDKSSVNNIKKDNSPRKKSKTLQMGIQSYTTEFKEKGDNDNEGQLEATLSWYLHYYHTLRLECNNKAVELEKLEAERRKQLKEMADFSEEVCTKIDQVYALEKEIDNALLEEQEVNEWLKGQAKQRRIS